MITKTNIIPRAAAAFVVLTSLAVSSARAAAVTPPLQQPYGSSWSEKDALRTVEPVKLAPPPSDRSAECDAQCLAALMDRYLDALSRRDYTGLPVSPNLLVTENAHATRIGDGVWKVLEKLDTGRTYLTDPVAGQVVMIGTLEESAHQPFIFIVRLKVENRLIAEVESMVTSDVNAAQHFRPDNLAHFDPATLASLPSEQRLPRAQLIADANQMLFGGNIKLTATKDCVHSENADRLVLFGACGVSDAARPDGSGLIYDNRAVRHVVVDEARGLVVTFMLKDTAPYLNPEPPDNERTPVFYQRPLTLYVMQIAKFEAGNMLAAHQLFMNAQEAGLAAVFLP